MYADLYGVASELAIADGIIGSHFYGDVIFFNVLN